MNGLARKPFAPFSGDTDTAALFGADNGGAPVAQATEAGLPGFASPSDDVYPRADVAAADTSGATDAGTVKSVATIAQLADYLVNGFWQYNNSIAHRWASSTISYNIDGLNAAEQFLAQSALNAWHEVANVNFVQTSGGANIIFNHNGTMTAVTNSGWNGLGQITSATVDISADWITNDGGARDGKTGIDSYGYQTYIHEIGHALGLGHQGPYNGSATYSANATFADDTWQYSIMSYFSEPNFSGSSYRYVITPQMADIYAAISIYGAATTRTGDTVYGFNSTAGPIFNFNAYSPAPALTIYDSGGNDTLDCSGYSAAQTIDLHAGSFSSVGGLIHNIGIATNTNIENAIGGSGNDTLIANDLGCVLQGGAGNDTLIGGSGNDRLAGGSGMDAMTGGGGADVFAFFPGDSFPFAGLRDWISDFQSGIDHIDLTGLNVMIRSGGQFRFIGTSAFDGGIGELDYTFDSSRGDTVVQADFNGDRVADFAVDLVGNIALSVNDFFGVVPSAVAIEAVGSTSLTLVASNYFLYTGGSGPSLKYFGSPVVAGQSGAYAPIAAEQTATGYDVAWKVPGVDQYTVWSTDFNGNYLANITGVVSGSSLALESLEPTFHQDLNSDGIIGIPFIEGFGSTGLAVTGGNYYLVSGGSGPSLKYWGSAVIAGQSGAFVPIAAEQTASGYDVAWKIPGADQYTVWSTDAAGNFQNYLTGVVSGSSLALESLETTFHQDLNSDGIVGIPFIEGFGSTGLAVAEHIYYLLSAGSGPSLKYFGAPVGFGQSGAYAPIAAEQTATGYDVAWKVPGVDQYTVWSTDVNGNYISNIVGVVSGSSLALESLETTFHQDLNSDGIIGIPFIEGFGSTGLAVTGGNYYLLTGGSGPSLKYLGTPVVAGQSGAYAPIAAEQTATGYDVAWKIPGADQYTVWSTDVNGNYVSNILGAVSASSSALKSIETTFHQDLNGDGVVGIPVASATISPAAMPAGEQFVFNPAVTSEVAANGSNGFELDNLFSGFAGNNPSTMPPGNVAAGQPQSLFQPPAAGSDTAIDTGHYDGLPVNVHIADLHTGNFIIH